LKKQNNFASSEEVFSWLSAFINLERGQKPKSFRIDRMQALCELAGNPHKCAPSVHIAGSKGKGSVTSMLAAILTASGFRTARYMSPHVADVRERICLDGSFFNEDTYCAAGCELREIIETRLPASGNVLFAAEAPKDLPEHARNAWSGCEPTYWELLTLFFFLCARYAKCDIMAVETGLGGRLDSTNVLEPLASVITLIELEHTNYLGSTIAEIAGEKAGIIKQGRPLILAEQRAEAFEVFKNASGEKNSPLYYLPDIIKISDINVTSHGTGFSLSNKSNLNAFAPSALPREMLNLHIPIPGKVQAQNAALAFAALQIISEEISCKRKDTHKIISEESIRRGLENIKIPARFEKISAANQMPFIIDGAHTPESLALCIETFCALYGEGGVLIFGCAADKDAARMAKEAHQYFSKIIITTPGTFKASVPAAVYGAFVKEAGKDKISLIADTQEAVKQAAAFNKTLPVLGTGSFYLVSEIRKITAQN